MFRYAYKIPHYNSFENVIYAYNISETNTLLKQNPIGSIKWWPTLIFCTISQDQVLFCYY